MASYINPSGAWSCTALVWNCAFPVLLLHRGTGSDIQDASEAAGGEAASVMSSTVALDLVVMMMMMVPIETTADSLYDGELGHSLRSSKVAG